MSVVPRHHMDVRHRKSSPIHEERIFAQADAEGYCRKLQVGGHKLINLYCMARATACVLLVASSFWQALAMWAVTVRSVIPRISPVSAADLPAAAQRRASRSRGVRRSE